MIPLRQEYREQLAEIEQRALGGLDLVVAALERTVTALRARDEALAARIVADDDRIDARYLEIHQALLSLMALQAPVAGDLRIVAALLHVIRHVERMGDQCVTIAKLIPLDPPDVAVDPPLMELIERAAGLVRGQVRQARRTFAQRDIAMARGLARADREVNELNRAAFRRAVEVGDDPARREWAMHMALASRGLERIGDNAVDIGEQAVFIVTGALPERAAGPRADGRRRPVDVRPAEM